MKIMMFNGLLLFLLFMWTSAETGPETELTEEIQVYANESRVDIQARKRACENLGGKCIKKKKDCPSRWHLETKPGKPSCSKNHRCCYPGPSCNLVWNYKEERPLIMIRDSKKIVPPVLDIEVSDNPSRIPIGRKLIFACPGENNQFNHVEGTHTKLNGECISHDHFKVCVNNNLEILDLSQLSCSRKMFPSFIKDNGTSDKKSCDGIGGEQYKTGYTYGDYHEFKDLNIEVCFREKDQTTLCTSPNRNGNETDFRTARGFKEIPGRDTRGGDPKPAAPCGTELDIPKFTNLLFDIDLDHNNVFKKIQLIDDGKGKKLLHATDDIFNDRPTFIALLELLSNVKKGKFEPPTNENEIIKDREALQNNFLNLIMATDVMMATKLFLKDSIGDLKAFIKEMWFDLYSRAKKKDIKGSSGFEHMFRGELSLQLPTSKQKAIGLHNWVYFLQEQDIGQLVYKELLHPPFLLGGEENKGMILDMKFTWFGYPNHGSSMLIGTSPELEMAVYTICFLLYQDKDCGVRMAGVDFVIHTDQVQHETTKRLLSSAYIRLPKA